jgi:hypothetical protein
MSRTEEVKCAPNENQLMDRNQRKAFQFRGVGSLILDTEIITITTKMHKEFSHLEAALDG